MRQAIIDGGFGIEQLVWREVAEPTPGVGQVLVRVRAVSLNYRDYLVALGKYNPKMPLPRVPMSDGVGEVVAVGARVTRWNVGDRVAGIFMQTWLSGDYEHSHGASALGGSIDGVMAELVVFDQDGLVAVPTHLTYEEAATLPCAAVTAWSALVERGGLKAGDTVLVLGSGGVSVFALQFAKAAGARVIATSSHPEKMEKLKALGADWVLNYKDVPEWGKAVAKAGGADHVVEVGGAGTLEQSLIAAKPSGTVSLIGVLTGLSGNLNVAAIFHKNLRVNGIYVGSRAMFENMNRSIAQNQIRPVIDTVFEPEKVQLALRYMESAAHFGKIVVRV